MNEETNIVPLRPGDGAMQGAACTVAPGGDPDGYKAVLAATTEMQRAMRAWCILANPDRDDAMLEAEGIGAVLRQIVQLYTRKG